jgi:hypothetical protein
MQAEISDRSVYRAAHVLLALFGDDAPAAAARMADKRCDRGDLAARGLWRRIEQAVADLQSRPSGPLH